jgi:hypothetical protein
MQGTVKLVDADHADYADHCYLNLRNLKESASIPLRGLLMCLTVQLRLLRLINVSFIELCLSQPRLVSNQQSECNLTSG